MMGRVKDERRWMMVIAIDAKLEVALKAHAESAGIPPEELALKLLRERLAPKKLIEPRDDWERELLAIGRDCGVSLSNEAASSEGYYD